MKLEQTPSDINLLPPIIFLPELQLYNLSQSVDSHRLGTTN
jgi:hypothetical protein